MRLPLMISVSLLVAPLGLSSQQVTEYDHVPRGYNKHPITTQTLEKCSTDGDVNADLHRRQNRIDPIPNYGWVWVTVDAIRNLEWPRAAGRVERYNWDGILTRAQRDSVRAYDGTPVAVDGYLSVDVRQVTVVPTRTRNRACESAGGDQVVWRLWLTRGRDDPRAYGIVVNVTEAMRQEGWDLAKLRDIARRGLMVRVWGWLLFDQEHRQVASRSQRSRVPATPWGVHPIVEIEVFEDTQTLVPLRDWQEGCDLWTERTSYRCRVRDYRWDGRRGR